MNWLAQVVNGMSDDSARRQKITNLGELRAALKALPADTPVLVNGTAPTGLASYRGMYERLAIGIRSRRDGTGTALEKFGASDYYEPGAAEVTIAQPATAAEVVRALDLADGEEFEGYKGGQYEMHPGTWMHVADYGDIGLAVYGVRFDGTTAHIEAGEYEW